MKKIVFYLVIVFILICFTYSSKCYAYSETGHEDFRKITFINEEAKLLNKYSSNEIEEGYKKVSKKIFGWSTYYFNIYEKIYYDGLDIFARSNTTRTSVDFEYVLRETTTTQRSVTVKGSVSTKITGTIKKINTTLSGELKGDKETQDSETYSSDAKTSLSIVINPKTKIVLLITGEGYLTSGVSKFTIFGICFKKGAWERIETDTTYYELREEKIK